MPDWGVHYLWFAFFAALSVCLSINLIQSNEVSTPPPSSPSTPTRLHATPQECATTLHSPRHPRTMPHSPRRPLQPRMTFHRPPPPPPQHPPPQPSGRVQHHDASSSVAQSEERHRRVLMEGPRAQSAAAGAHGAAVRQSVPGPVGIGARAARSCALRSCMSRGGRGGRLG